MKKNCSIDIFRAICAILVVIQHIPVFIGEHLYENNIWFFFTSRIARIAVPFFFIVSGYFYIQKLQKGENTLRKQIKTLLKYYILWNIIYIPYHIYVLFQKNVSIFGAIKTSIYSLIFEGFGWQLWYISALVFSITCTTIAYKKNFLKPLAISSIFIYYLTSIILAYSNSSMLNNLEILQKIINFKHFNTFRRFALFGLPLFLTGYFVESFIKWFASSKIKMVFLLIFTSILFLVEQQIIINFQGQTVMSLFLYPLTIIIFSLCLIYPNYNKEYLAKFSKIYSNILYFSHVFIIWIINIIIPTISERSMLFLTLLFSAIISLFLYFYNGKWSKILKNLY